MSDAENVEITTKFDDSLGQIESAFKIEKLAARASQSVSILIKDISPEVLKVFKATIDQYYLTEGRVGLNLEFTVSIGGEDAVPSSDDSNTVYLPMNRQSLFMLQQLVSSSEHQKATMKKELSFLEAIGIIILFVAISHFLSYLCHKRAPESPPKDTEVACLADFNGED